MMNSEPLPTRFEAIKHTATSGTEFWLGRELMPLLGYTRWENFEEAIARAKVSCRQFNQKIVYHFRDSRKMIEIGKGAQREIQDCYLSRYACYLIAQNGDPRKPEIAAAQAYFVIQTRRQEIQDAKVIAEEKRVEARLRLTSSNKRLFSTAKQAGVTRYGIFQDEGYKGLYGGLGYRAIKQYKGIPENDELLDRMGHTELAANDFRATQAEERLRREGVHDEGVACIVHHAVGQSVRQIIEQQGNTLPENLAIEPNIKPLIEKHKRLTHKAVIAKSKESDNKT